MAHISSNRFRRFSRTLTAVGQRLAASSINGLDRLEARVLLSGATDLAHEASAALMSTPAAVTLPANIELPGHQLKAPRQSTGSATSKISSNLLKIMKIAAPGAEFTGVFKVDATGAVETTIKTAGPVANVIQELASLGVHVSASNDQYHQIDASILPSQVESVAALADVSRVELPKYGEYRAGAVSGQGDATHHAADVRDRFAALGIDGSGVKIGIISDGLDNLDLVSPSGDAPAVVTIDPSQPGAGQEGTAVLEVIYDLAPGADYYFSGVSTTTTMVNAIDYLIGQGVNVIIDDLGFPGVAYFQDDIVAQKAAEAVADGISYVTAAGNDAENHWQGQYVEGPCSTDPCSGTNWHWFVQDVNILNGVFIPAGSFFLSVLQWSDPLGASANDYDLYLFNYDTFNFEDYSIEVQDGTQDPFEFVIYDNTAGASDIILYMLVDKYFGDPREMEILTFGNPGQQYIISEDSVYGHAAVESVITAGAVKPDDPSSIEFYSSASPSTIYTDFDNQISTQRFSLDGMAIDGINTQNGALGNINDPFYGTSASAANTAGIVALMRDANPAASPADIQTALNAAADDLGGGGYDFDTGNGRFDALHAVYHVYTPPAPTLDPASDSGALGDGITDDDTPTFTGTVATGSFVRLLVDNVEAATTQLSPGVGDYSITVPSQASGVHQFAVQVAEDGFQPENNYSNVSASTEVTIGTSLPTVDIVDVTPDPRSFLVGAIDINFNTVVTGFGLADLTLTRGGIPVSLATADISTGDGRHYQLGGLFDLTDKPGHYVLTLTAAGSGIQDLGGTPLSGDASDDWLLNTLTGPNFDDDIRIVAGAPGFANVFLNNPGPAADYAINLTDFESTPLIVAGEDGDDKLTVDFSAGNPMPAAGIYYDGGINGGFGDELAVIGTGSSVGVYSPSTTVAGEGTVDVGGEVITFAGLEPVSVSGFSSVTLALPNVDDALVLDSPSAGVSRVSGSSGLVGIESLRFADSTTLVIDAGAGTNIVIADSGTTNLDSTAGSNLNLVVQSTAVVNLVASQTFAEISILNDGRVNLTAGGEKLIQTDGVVITDNGILDLTDNDMIVQSDSANDASVAAELSAQIGTGRGTGDWDGVGIISSTAANDPTALTGLAILLNDDGSDNVVRADFDGQIVDSNTILIKYSWNGDTDLSGIIDADDYFRIDSGFAGELTGYTNGDFDFSGSPDADDYFLIDSAFSGQNGPLAALARKTRRDALIETPVFDSRKDTPRNKRGVRDRRDVYFPLGD